MIQNAKFVNGLLALKQVFDKHNIFFWLECGTLLGAVREGKIISWDNDVDVSTWLNDITKIAQTQKDFHRLGYEIYFHPGIMIYEILKQSPSAYFWGGFQGISSTTGYAW